MSTEEKQNHPPPGAREGPGGARELASGVYKALEAKRHQPKPPPDDPETDMEPQPEDDGPRILGDPDEGCRFCGAVFSYFNEDFNILTYYPGVECCVETIDVQLDRVCVRLTQLENENQRHPSTRLGFDIVNTRLELERLREKRRDLEDRQVGLKDASDAA